MDTNKWLKWTLVGAGALVIAIVAVVLLASQAVSVAQASPAVRTVASFVGSSSWAHPGMGWGPVDMQELLADALGISVAELEEAQQAATEKAVAEAVEAGYLTQEQADQMLDRSGFFGWGFGRGHGGFGRGPGFDRFGSGIDYHALLADELGIKVEELQAAHESAGQAAFEQMLEEGIITEEQAELRAAAQALKEYVDRDALMAEALGISVDALEDARAEGKTLSELLEEQGLESATYRENLAAAHEAAIAQAVKDGVITQDQADLLQSFPAGECGFGRGGRGGFRGGGFFGPGMKPAPADVDTLDA